MSKVKHIIREVIGSYTDENGAVKELTTIVGEAWPHSKGDGMDIVLYKKPQEELVTELDHNGKERLVMRPNRLKSFPMSKETVATAKSNPADVLKKKVANGKDADMEVAI